MEKPPSAAALNPANDELDNLPPTARAVRARGIINEAKAIYAAVGDAAIVEALQTASYVELAREIGVSVSAVNKAVSRHRARDRAGDEQPGER
jgi:hypothetical protein